MWTICFGDFAFRCDLLLSLNKSRQKSIRNQGSEASFLFGQNNWIPVLLMPPTHFVGRRAARVGSAVFQTGHPAFVDADCISLAAAFCKSHFSLISSHLLSESNPLRFRLIRLLRGAFNCTVPLTAKTGCSIAFHTAAGAVGAKR